MITTKSEEVTTVIHTKGSTTTTTTTTVVTEVASKTWGEMHPGVEPTVENVIKYAKESGAYDRIMASEEIG